MNIYEFYTDNELLTLRNTLRTTEYALLIRFLGDYLTDFSAKVPENEKEIKGMAQLLHKMKTLLCTSFNIGFIQINKEVPKESEIVTQAPKTDLERDMMNRISINSDFKQFLYNISKMYGKHSNEEYLKIKWDI